MRAVVMVCFLILGVSSVKEIYDESPFEFHRIETNYYDLLRNMKVDEFGGRYYVAKMKVDKHIRLPLERSDPFFKIFSKS